MEERAGESLTQRLARLSENRRALLALELQQTVPAASEAPARPAAELLAACVVPREGQQPSPREIRRWLRQRLPEHMVPGRFVVLGSLPRSPGGKVDQQELLAASRRSVARPPATSPPGNETEAALAAIWRDVLGIETVGMEENFFDLGGHSFLLIQVQQRVEEFLGRELPVVELFRFPTIRTLAASLDGLPPPASAESLRPTGAGESAAAPTDDAASVEPDAARIAIVGMAGRFPGAGNVEHFWQNLLEGVESISVFSDEELLAEGWDARLLRMPECVKARGIVDGIEDFDAEFFGFSRREAEITDPQQRLFLETAYRALENAGYPPERFGGRVGVFAGAGQGTYGQHLARDPELRRTVGDLLISIGNERDYLATRTSYKLNLKGPSVTVQTACSTSLVAVHYAVQSLLRGECDLALSGGVALSVPVKRPLLKVPGDIVSPDGRCRAFDARAAGTVGGQGVGVVVLKRLREARRDGDQIYGVIRGSAINNDGSEKVGYTAPSVEGQTQAISQAMAAGGVAPETIGYVEAHGTGTELGDPIEVAALQQAFAGVTERRSCALGSVKTNIGHLDAAAGVAGLIKATLAVHRGQVPPSLHFEQPNPKIDFAKGPFYVQAKLGPWPHPGRPRRAGVSSFGIGGTNVHVVLEEPPPMPADEDRTHKLLVLSGRTPGILERLTSRLADHLEQHPETDLADVAFTLQVGRRSFVHRRIVVAFDHDEAVRQLRVPAPRETAALRLLEGNGKAGLVSPGSAPPVAFLFPGQGAQHVGMGRELYRSEPVYRRQLDRLAELFEPHLGLDLRRLVDPPPAERDAAARRLAETRCGQATLFAVELALARLWTSWGITPAALLGHSLGEYVAACLAGTFSVEEAVTLVAARGRMMQDLPAGAMLAVSLSDEELAPLLGPELALSALNGPARSVVSGPHAAIDELERRLAARQVPARRLATTRAFHSPMVEPIVEPFGECVSRLALSAPAVPWISNVTGTWIRPHEATDPSYWARHLRSPVRFSDGLAELVGDRQPVLLEVGPGRTLAALARRHPVSGTASGVVSSLAGSSGPAPRQGVGEAEAVLAALGRLWLAGVEADWQGFHAGRQRRRVSLPPTPFERRRYWLAPRAGEPGPAPAHRDESAADAVAAQEPDAGSPSAVLYSSADFDLLCEPEEHPGRPEGAPVSATSEPGEDARGSRNADVLAEIWSQVLGPPQIAPEDDFYALGGDSLLAIRVVALARQRGLDLRQSQVLEHSRFVDLVAVLDAAACSSSPEAPDHGPVPLSPSQQPFFAGYRVGHYWNQAYFFELRRELRRNVLSAAITELLRHHDALRLRFIRRRETWQQISDPIADAMSLSSVDLRAIPAARQPQVMTAAAAQLQPGFDFALAPLVRFVYFDLGPERHGRLFFLAPHILVDAIALEVLIEDLQSACQQLERGQSIELPAKSAPFLAWCERLAAYARSSEIEAELEDWLGLPWSRTGPLPWDHPGADNARGSVDTLTLEWTRQETRILTREIPASLGVSVEEILLAALVWALAEWTGRTAHVVTMLGHGRIPLFEDLDVTRTLGYFTTRYPVVPELAGTEDPVRELRGIAAQLRQIRNGGLGYAVLRYMSPEPRIRAKMESLPAAEVRLNYLSRIGLDTQDAGPLLRWSNEDPGPVVPPFFRRRVLLDLVGLVDGDRLRFRWSFSRNCHKRSTIERLAKHFEAFVGSLLSSFPNRKPAPGDVPALRTSPRKRG